MNPARRVMVRTAIVTSSTIATAIGAQSLALLDLHNGSQQASAEQPAVEFTQTINTPAGKTAITESLPAHITVLRQGDPNAGGLASITTLTRPNTSIVASSVRPSSTTTNVRRRHPRTRSSR